MTKPLDRELTAILAACQNFYLTNPGDRDQLKKGEIYKLLKKALTTILKAMAELHSVSYSGYVVDRKHVGYLIKLEPPKVFRVPYHVLPAFPTGAELDEIWELSCAIRSGNRSTISISGSAVLRQIFDVIADIDFCEYFPVNDISGFDRLASNMDGNEKIACVKVAFADKKWHYPWGDDRPTAEFFSTMIDTSDEDRSTMKVDYIGDAGHLGVTEITNLIIAIDESGRSAGLTRTFAAQEAPLVPIDWLPNQMNDPIEMGRYINQLTDSIVAMSKKGDMRKCMKRCAALSRVIFAKDITNEIMDLVKKSSTYHSHKLQELEKISVMLKLLKDGRSIRLNTLISTQVKELEVTLSKRGGIPDESVRKQFDDEARGIADRLLRYVRFGDDRRAA